MKQKALALCYKRKTRERLYTQLDLTPKTGLVVNSYAFATKVDSRIFPLTF